MQKIRLLLSYAETQDNYADNVNHVYNLAIGHLIVASLIILTPLTSKNLSLCINICGEISHRGKTPPYFVSAKLFMSKLAQQISTVL